MNHKDDSVRNNCRAIIGMILQVAEQRGIAQYKLAEMVGVTPVTMNRIATGVFIPNFDIIIAMGMALKLGIFFQDTSKEDTPLNKAFEDAMDKLGRRPDKLPKN